MKTFPKVLAFTFSLMVDPILAEGDLPAGAVARLGSNHFAHLDKVEAIAFSPDGSSIMSIASGEVVLWDVTTAEKLESHPLPDHMTAVFDPSGSSIELIPIDPPYGRARFCGDRVHVEMWNALDSRGFYSGEGGSRRSNLEALGFSPDRERVAVVRWNEPMQIFSIGAPSEPVTLEGEAGSSKWMRFSPDGKQLAGSCKIRTGARTTRYLLRIWNAETGEKIRDIGGDSRDGDYTPDGKWEIGLRDLRSGKDLRILEGGSHILATSASLSSDERYLSVGGGLWNLETGEPLLEDSNNRVRKSTFSPDSRLFAFIKDKHIQIWEMLSQSLIHEIGLGEGEVHDLAFSPDGTVIAAAGNGSTLIWDMTGILRDRELPEIELSQPEMRTLWNSLGNEADPWSAHLAAWKLSAAGESAVEFIQRNLSPAVAPESAQLAFLRTKLTDESYDVRDFAARELVDLGIELSPEEWNLLRRPLPDFSSDPIPKAQLEYGPPPTLLPLPERARSSRALAALERSRSSVVATALLDELSEGNPDSPLTKEVRSIMNRLSRE